MRVVAVTLSHSLGTYHIHDVRDVLRIVLLERYHLLIDDKHAASTNDHTILTSRERERHSEAPCSCFENLYRIDVGESSRDSPLSVRSLGSQ